MCDIPGFLFHDLHKMVKILKCEIGQKHQMQANRNDLIILKKWSCCVNLSWYLVMLMCHTSSGSLDHTPLRSDHRVKVCFYQEVSWGFVRWLFFSHILALIGIGRKKGIRLPLCVLEITTRILFMFYWAGQKMITTDYHTHVIKHAVKDIPDT